MINGLLELLTTKRWAMQPEALDAYRHIIQSNLAGHVALEPFSKKEPYRLALNNSIHMESDNTQDSLPTGEGRGEAVAILPVCGPITRNGDACSYGSLDLRDAIMEASDDADCAGIIFYINTPGGSVAAIPDFKYAIDYAHNKGKKVIAFVDGLCASCGMYLAALCDKRYYMNKEDQIGCIGVLAAFYTEKDGSYNQYTNETYHELYATQSPAKNKWHRDAAEGDYTELQAQLDKDCEDFHNVVKAACPNVKPEHLTGAVFNAVDVDGILMDGQATLDDIIASLVSSDTSLDPERNNNQAPAQGISSLPMEEGQGGALNSINMNNYPLINAALGMEEGSLVVEEAGTHLDATLLDKMEATLTEQAKQLADIKAALKETEEQLATAQSDKETADKALADANAAHTTECEAHNAALTKLTNELLEAQQTLAAAQEAGAKALSAVQSELEGAKASLATAEQTIADRDAQIAALTAAPAPAQRQGEAPANNGTEAHNETLRTDFPHWDGKESMTEFKARLLDWHKTHC